MDGEREGWGERVGGSGRGVGVGSVVGDKAGQAGVAGMVVGEKGVQSAFMVWKCGAGHGSVEGGHAGVAKHDAGGEDAGNVVKLVVLLPRLDLVVSDDDTAGTVGTRHDVDDQLWTQSAGIRRIGGSTSHLC